MRNPVVLVVGVTGLAILAAAVAVASRDSGAEVATFRGSTAVPGFEMPSFVLRDHRGRELRSSDLRGRVTLLTFLDSQCTEACPVIAFDLARGIDALSPREREDVVAVALSTDPAEDTGASVNLFLRARHALGRIRYLVSPAEALKRLWGAFQILPSVRSGEDSIHSAPVRIYGRDGSWSATLHAGADLTHENLLHDVRVALLEKS